MNEFLLVFRGEAVSDEQQPSPEQMQGMMKLWQDWMGSIAAQNKLANPGNRLAAGGRVVKTGGLITNGPYVEIKEAIGGYIIVKADNIDEVAELAKGCPIFAMNGNVEVREIVPMD